MPRSGSWSPPEKEARLRELQTHMRECYHGGRYAEALEAGGECHDLAVASFGSAHPAVASVCNNLALMHKSLGDLDKAAALYKEALDCYRNVLGEEHTSTATAACNLALLHRDSQDAARVREARTLLEGVLETRRQVLGEGHVEVAATMGHLASVVKLDGDDGPERAKALLQRALASAESGDRERLPTVEREVLRASLLNSLGLLHKQAGELGEAERLYTRSAELREQWLGATHPHTIASLHNLAELARAAGDEPRALHIQHGILRRLGADVANDVDDADTSHPGGGGGGAVA